jgi:molybdopterin molybdotransferase
MDGFAVQARDIARCGASLRLVGESAAGSSDRPKVLPGTCVQTLTGAVIPRGADTVVKVEETKIADGRVTFLTSIKRGANIRRRAEVAAKGDTVLAAGTMLGPSQIGLCASVGKAVVPVYRRPAVTVLCTGRELRDASEAVRAYQLRNSNGPSLLAALADEGHVWATQQIVGDDPDVLAASLKSAIESCDVVILTGGVSVGKYDFVPGAVEQIGATVRFHGVKMKPGGPQLYATMSRNRHIFGLPGNPLSALNGLHELALPAIRRMSGIEPGACQPALHLPLGRAVRVKGTRWEYVLARLVQGPGQSHLIPLKSTGSGDLLSAARGDGVFLIPKGASEVPAGQIVEFRPWKTLA